MKQAPDGETGTASAPAFDGADEVTRLERVLSRDTAARICESLGALLGVGIRVIGDRDGLLGEYVTRRRLCERVNETNDGARACFDTVRQALSRLPDREAVLHACFTGAVYRVVPIAYQGRTLGRVIIGPYVPAATTSPPASLFDVCPSVEPADAQASLEAMPRVRDDVAEQISAHLQVVFDRLIFEGHRAELAVLMQARSARASHQELAETEEELRSALDELEELGKLKSSFLATVSHELRTPLTSIIGYSEMLEGGAAGVLNETQTEFLDTIRDKAEQLLDLIGSLLDLGRLEAGSLKLDRKPIDAHALLSDIGSTIVPVANRAQISLDIDVVEGTPKIDGDATRLRQVLLNLADNAVKFTPPSGRVWLRARPASLPKDATNDPENSTQGLRRPAVLLEVEDTGRGIAEDKRSRIFDPFYQIDGGTTREVGGAGLGLSIVKQVVDAHGGTIEMTSELDAGTRFAVVLPSAGIDD